MNNGRQNRKIKRHLLEPVCLLLLLVWYGLDRRRRMVWKKRAGALTGRNLIALARNAAFMLTGGELTVKGDLPPTNMGAIFYSLHFGIWELVPRVLSRYGVRLGIMTNHYPPPWGRLINRLLRRYRTADGVTIFYPEQTRSIVDFLNTGGWFAILVDGQEHFSKLKPIEKLSRMCSVPLIPFAAYQDRGRGVVAIGCDLARLVRKRPWDYAWLYYSRQR